MSDDFVHVGRQPIFDIGGDVVAYELLFRAGGSATGAEVLDGDVATATVIVNTFSQFGVRALVGPSLAFVNITRPFVTGELALPFEPDRVVLEVLETVVVDDELVEGCRRLVDAGYRLALDDLVPDDHRGPLLELASYGKLDFGRSKPDELTDIAARCRDAGMQLVAEKVESEEDIEAAWMLGCSLFQGHHLAQAQVVSSPNLEPGRLNCLRLMGILAQEDVSFDDIEELVRQEPALAFRVLTAANSAASGARREITSVRDALVMLGVRQLRGWLQLMLISDLAGGYPELFSSAVIRARTCELLASERAGLSEDAAFTAGLVSYLDLLLGQPIEWVVAKMGLGGELHFALTAGAGPLGELLRAVRGYEEDAESPVVGDYRPADLAQAFLAGVEWSRRSETAAVTS